MDADIVFKYFPDLNAHQRDQFKKLGPAYQDWNVKINVVSRKDVDLLYERHVLHSLGIACFKNFEPGTSVLDVGTGGGFPGIPLAIMFPQVQFTLVDSIRKKIGVVKDVVHNLGLENVKALVTRAENLDNPFDYVVSRAVMKTESMIHLLRKQMDYGCTMFLLKGGDLSEELKPVKKSKVLALSDCFEEDFFLTKKVVVVKIS